jgi:hypothetical protein
VPRCLVYGAIGFLPGQEVKTMRRLLQKRVWLAVVTGLLLTSGSAYALFSSTITFGGVNVTIGNSALQIQLPDGSWVNDSWTTGYTLGGLYPGLTTSVNFKVKNASTAPINLDVSAALVSAGGDYEELKDIITVRVRDAANSHYSTGYKTLAAWHADSGIGLPGKAIAQGDTREYTLDIQIYKKYGNELANKSLRDVTVQLTGVQED